MGGQSCAEPFENDLPSFLPEVSSCRRPKSANDLRTPAGEGCPEYSGFLTSPSSALFRTSVCPRVQVPGRPASIHCWGALCRPLKLPPPAPPLLFLLSSLRLAAQHCPCHNLVCSGSFKVYRPPRHCHFVNFR